MKKRILLERFISQRDFSYFAKLAFNEAVMKMNMGRVFTKEEAEGYFQSIMEYNFANEKSGTYKVFEIESKSYIGICSLWQKEGIAEVEYMVLPEYWGKGFATEMVNCLIEYAKQNPAINKLNGLIDPTNSQSKNVLTKNGFILEGQMRVEENNSVVDVYTLIL